MQRRSLRWRLAWGFTLLSSLVVLLQAVALFVNTEDQEEDTIDEVINTTLDDYFKRADPPADLTGLAPTIRRMHLYRLPQGQVPPQLPKEFATLPEGNHELEIGDTEYHIGIRNAQSERLFLIYDVTDHEDRLRQLRWNLLAGMFASSVLSLWLGHWLAGRMLRQLQKITERLQSDDESILSEPALDREVGMLAHALDDYRQRNRELLAREREFAANVSHELRTPLTRMRTSAELLSDDISLSGRAQERATRIVADADDMEARLRSLLFLARELALTDRSQINLLELVQASVAQFGTACDAAGVELEIAVPQHALIDADAALLRLLLDNLIGNAVRYTQQGRIIIGYDKSSLTVSDTGSGIAAEHLAHVFDRHYRASDVPGGSGLGLSIVKRICDAHGWQCSIDSIAIADHPGRGTRITVQFLPDAAQSA